MLICANHILELVMLYQCQTSSHSSDAIELYIWIHVDENSVDPDPNLDLHCSQKGIYTVLKRLSTLFSKGYRIK